MYADVSFFRRILNFLLVIPVYIIISSVTIIVTIYYTFDESGFTIEKALLCTLFYCFSFMVGVCHTRSMLTNPGYVQSSWKMTEQKIPGIPENCLTCNKCKFERPYRAHHCKICNKCTLKMDHHCPWIANCVGFRNQKYFYQFLFFATFGDLFAFIMLTSSFIRIKSDTESEKEIVESVIDVIWALRKPLSILIGCILSASMTISIGLLFYFQTKLIMNNSTTIENRIYTSFSDSPWYFDNKLHNFKIVMGENIIDWFLPTFESNVYNNGYSFCTPKQSKDIDQIDPFDKMKGTYHQLGNLELSMTNRNNQIE